MLLGGWGGGCLKDAGGPNMTHEKVQVNLIESEAFAGAQKKELCSY